MSLKIGHFFLLLFFIGCKTIPDDKVLAEPVRLAISKHIDLNDKDNQLIADRLQGFLETKNESHFKNDYWLDEDFSKYYFPYLDLYMVEQMDSIPNYYKPTLLEIIDTDDESIKIIKLAYIGTSSDFKESHLKCIYNLIATKKIGHVVFSNPLEFMTKSWEKFRIGTMNYVISPNKKFNDSEAFKQQEVIEAICEFFETEPLDITYYSCVNPVELFNIKGFDYDRRMHLGKSGGLAINHNIILSANNSEIYTHEILHLFNAELFPTMPKLINEGLAMYIGGSGKNPYSWHRNNLKNHIKNGYAIDFSLHLEPFEKLYLDDETSLPYMIGALICERTFRQNGKEGLIKLLKGEKEFWALLNDVGLTPASLDAELKKELELPPKMCLRNAL